MERDSEVKSLMSATHSHQDRDGVPIASQYGSRFTSGGRTDKAEGHLRRRVEGGVIICRLEISYSRSLGDLPRPPRDYKPLSSLIGVESGPLGPISGICHVAFEYDLNQGYTSKVPLPVPLIFPDGSRGATHIEGYEFSRRDDDKVDFRITVTQPHERNVLMHVVHFETTLELNRRTLRGLRDRARSISAQFLVLQEGQNGADAGAPLGL